MFCFKNKNKIVVYNYNYLIPSSKEHQNFKKIVDNYIKKYYNICIETDLFKKLEENENYLNSKEIILLVSPYKYNEIKNNYKFNISINPTGKYNKNTKKIIDEIYNTYLTLFKMLFIKKELYNYFENFLRKILYDSKIEIQEEWIVFNIYIILKYLVNS